MQMPERSLSGGYRFGFNGKEKDNEFKGEGDSYNFDSRVLDVRLGKWCSVDPKAWKFPEESPYTFVSNNPIIYVDPNGEAKIVVTGGKDDFNKYQMNFVNASFLQLKNYAEQILKDGKNESLCWIILSKGYDQKQIELIKKMAAQLKVKVTITFVKNAQEVFNLINSNNKNSSGLSEERLNDKVTNISFFSHGVNSIIALGYTEDDGAYITDNKELMENITTDNVLSIDRNAFDVDYKGGSIDIFSCNAAVPANVGCRNDQFCSMKEYIEKCSPQKEKIGFKGLSLVSLIGCYTGMTTTGYIGKTDYVPVASGKLPTSGKIDCTINGERPTSFLKTINYKK
jgi:RHS repeat-associated protein